MTFKEARKNARELAKHRYAYLIISKQQEIGWYADTAISDRAVYFVNKDGSLELLSSTFAINYHRQYMKNLKLKNR